jgi:hypothetical protein
MSYGSLHVQEPGYLAYAYPINKPLVHVGRNDSNDLVIEDDTVSRHHLSVTLYQWSDGVSVSIKDIGSYNGTTLDGQGMNNHESYSWLGQTVEVGDTVLRWEPPASARVAALRQDSHSCSASKATGSGGGRAGWFLGRAALALATGGASEVLGVAADVIEVASFAGAL